MTINVALLDALDCRIAGAGRNDEKRIFDEVLDSLAVATDAHGFCAAHAFAEAAIAIHRALLPADGYNLGETAARKGLASTWRRGEAHMLPFEAATPGLALLRATAHAAASRIHRDRRVACGICGGLGRTITRKGGKRLCRHGLAS